MSDVLKPTAIDQDPPITVTVWVAVPNDKGHLVVTGECQIRGDQAPCWKSSDGQTGAILTRAMAALKLQQGGQLL